MRSWVRLVFILGTGALWLVALLVAAELYTLWQWRQIDAHNPYLRARRGEIPWPGSDVSAKRLVVQTPEEPAEKLPVPPPIEERTWRAAYFATLDEADREIFSAVYEQNIFLLDPGGAVRKAHIIGPTPPALTIAATCGAETSKAVDAQRTAVLQSGVPQEVQVPSTGHTAYLIPYPEPGPGRDILGVYIEAPREPLAGDNAVWEIPFLLYRKHAERGRIPYSTENLGVEQFATNNYGFRDDEVRMPKPPGTYRIVCVGASTTEEGPTNAVTYPNELERLLNDHFPGRDFDVINAGVAGMNITKERMRMSDYLALDPDAIIVYNAVNDIAHFHFKRWLREWCPWQRLLVQSRFLAYHFNGLLVPAEAEIARALREKTISKLLAMHAYAARHGVPVILSSFAHPDIDNLSGDERDYFDLHAYDIYDAGSGRGQEITFATYCRVVGLYNRLLHEACRQEQVPFVPIAENIRGGTELFGDVCHMKNRGIRKKARVFFEQLTGPLAHLLPDRASPVEPPEVP